MAAQNNTPANGLGLKHPLSVTIGARLDNLTRLGLKTETTMDYPVEEAGEFSGVLISAHAPVLLDEMRHNIAATDAEFRRMSIERVMTFVDAARRHPHVRQVNMHFAPKLWNEENQTRGNEGTYDLQIEGIREIAAFAAHHGLEIVLENNNAYWTGIPDDVPPDEVDWTGRNEHFGASPEEWVQVCEDVDRPNVGLCLDSSHTCTYAHTFPEDKREERVLAFLSRPELIKHVHWNDNYLHDIRGRVDSHAVLGKGSLPLELHRGIKSLDATLLIEHFYSTEELEGELEFIKGL